MRVKGIRFEQVMLAVMLLAALCWNLANAAEIKQLRVEAGATGTRAELQLDRQGDYKVIELRNPDRLVVDFSESRLSRNLAMPAGVGAVKSVRTGQPQPGTVRVVFDLAGQVKVMPPRIETTAAGPRLVLEWPGDASAAAPVAIATAPPQPDPIAEIAKASAAVETDPAKLVGKAATVSELPGTVATGVPTRIATGKPEPVAIETPAVVAAPVAPTPRQVMQPGMRPLVISIDAGHGGQDPGAIGPNGNREKNVTLAIARELARQINATPGMKAHLTRDADVFKADIFVSIHADAAENRSATGSSVYVMSTRGASSQRARWLADKENAADLIGGVKLADTGDTLKSVLLDLTQSGQMKASSDAANHVLGSLGSVGKTRRVCWWKPGSSPTTPKRRCFPVRTTSAGWRPRCWTASAIISSASRHPARCSPRVRMRPR
jgi:N-acetylmuramoyl-L-alanine amidase